MSDASQPAEASEPKAIKVWDLAVRLCHIGFTVLIPLLWWTAENSHWLLHKRLGLCLLGLLVFRMLWGVFGTRTARFASFVRGPRAVLAYLRGLSDGTDQAIGHNPLGALSVVALLLAMLAQAGSGLFAGDPFDGATGPLNHLVSVNTADRLTDWHTWFYNIVLALVGLHLLAIAYYQLIRRADLVGPMLTGRRHYPTERVDNDLPSVLGLSVSLIPAFAFIAWVLSGIGAS